MAEPRKPPTSRISRSARLGGLVAGQSARWVGTRAANIVRSPERAEEATGERAAALARELVEQLGQMRGAAMKVGQVLSTIDFTALPEDERENFKQTLSALRDDVPPLPFKQVEKLLRDELGEQPAKVFASFEEEAFAAASIGQVHRAVTREGQAVAVKVQYPGVAEAVDTDLRNLTLLLPLVKRLAPGLDVKALYAELRERIAEELDYELEAQNQRAVARAHRGHPFAHVPEVHTELSSRRVLVTDLLVGDRFEAVKQRDDATRDRFGEIVFRFYFGLVHHLGRVCGDPHPGNYLLLDDGRVGFLDFGLMRVLERGYLEREAAVAVAVEAGDAAGVHAALSGLGYLPDPSAFVPEDLLAQVAAMGAVVPRAGRAAHVAGLGRGAARRDGRAALAVLPADAAPDAAAAGAAAAAHGGAGPLHARRGPRGGRLERDRPRVLRRRGAVDAARRGRARVLVGPSGRGLSARAGAASPRSPRATRRSAGSGGRARPPPRRACRCRRTGRGRGRRAGRTPGRTGGPAPRASASGSPSSRGRWGRRSCARSRRSGACRARAARA